MTENSQFDKIRPFYDREVNAAIRSILNEPMLKTIMDFAFPDMTEAAWKAALSDIHTTQDFQAQIVSKILYRVLSATSSGVSTSGFENLDTNTAYLYISNHRDIVLDTSLLNLTLFEHNMILTASAIGDNLVRMPFLNTLAKINRNFLVLRGLSPRELLMSSKLMSEYILSLVDTDNRSVWLAQREGRTKDGNDLTHPGILKMLSIAAGKGNLVAYFKKLNIVPVSISYEYDPTDILKIPELLAKKRNEKYEKSENEDFNSIAKGIMGQKKGIHIHVGKPLNEALDSIENVDNANQQIKMITQMLDREIVGNYKLWTSNYIAADLLTQTTAYSAFYTAEEKAFFVERMEKRIDTSNQHIVEQFLAMYANPISHKQTVLTAEVE